ncbi:unnamed protein product [Aspergillus oryzae]|uniref:Unnamed protein product n=1 Tax=Aspergillus oryzae TaxID=5062 RepID=A0AAN5BTQ8_ASPOZ|nr:unnamed protein product [Aspergillus oryzae]GMF96859.1 unnamed protein product [Aspergillus oryzae]GMG26081.1 unnamed protein product [Aspergillus oryzae]
MANCQVSLALASVDHNPLGDVLSKVSCSDVLARELRDDGGISLAEGTGAAEGVDLASTAEDGLALLVGGGIGGAEELSADGGLNRGIDVLESVTLGEDVATGADLEGVALNIVEVVVDGVEEGVALDLGHTAGGVVEVVTHHGDHVVGAVKVNTPVVVAVAGSGVVGATVDEGVGDGDTVVGLGTEDDVLTGDTGSGNMIDPDKVGLVQSDGITTPDILGVDVSDSNVSVLRLVSALDE